MSAHVINDRRSSSGILNSFGRNARTDNLSPVIPDGPFNYGFYDAVSYSQNRAARPFFATDSRFTLTSWSRLRAMSLARWGYINIHFVKGAVDLMARLTVGTGFSPKTHHPDKHLAEAADAYFLDKAQALGFMHGESLAELLLHDSRCVDVDGDLGYLLTSDETDEPKLQLIEGHRIKNGDRTDSNLRDGVWTDGYGRRVAFNVELPEENRTHRIEARDFIYLAERNRPDELRSMTNLIHALAPLQDLYEILGFAMASAKKNSEIAATIETPNPKYPPGLGPLFSMPMAPAQAANGETPARSRQTVTREAVYASGGKIPILAPGEEFKTYAHAQPSPTIQQWAEFIIRGIAVGFGVSFEVLWNPEAIGGANTRLITALLRARLIQRRHALVIPKLKRVRYWILGRAVKRRELPAADYTSCDWQPNFSDITVDAGRESRERRQNVIQGLDTFTGYYSEDGKTYGRELGVREADVMMQCAAAARLVQKYPALSFSDALARISLLTTTAAEIQAGNSNRPPNE
jgi:hypothetical protein